MLQIIATFSSKLCRAISDAKATYLLSFVSLQQEQISNLQHEEQTQIFCLYNRELNRSLLRKYHLKATNRRCHYDPDTPNIAHLLLEYNPLVSFPTSSRQTRMRQLASYLFCYKEHTIIPIYLRSHSPFHREVDSLQLHSTFLVCKYNLYQYLSSHQLYAFHKSQILLYNL